MANFEGLIRQALASQNASDPAVRQRIYQSSRNALARMLEKTGNTGDEVVRAQFGRLEDSIDAIEAEFSAPVAAPENKPDPVREFEATPQPTPEPTPEPKPVQTPEPSPGQILEPAPVQQTVRPQVPSQPDQRPQTRSGYEAPVTVTWDNEPRSPAEPAGGLPPGYTPKPLFPPVDADAPITPATIRPAPVPQPERYPPEPRPIQAASPNTGQPVQEQTYERAGRPVREPASEAAYRPAEVTPTYSQARETYRESYQESSRQSEGEATLNPHFAQPPDTGAEPSTRSRHGSETDFGSGVEPRLPERTFEQAPEQPYDPRPVEPYLGDYAPGQSGEPETYSTQAEPARTGAMVADPDRAPVYKRRNPLARRIWPIAMVIAVLLVILWIMYALLTVRSDQTGEPQGTGNTSQTAEDGTIITLLRPTDLSALVTAGRGSAELVTELNQQMLRLKSIRQGTAAGANAEPMLLELEKGVLRQISGKQVTVEFYSKSGSSGPAQFAVQCDIGGDSVCGRKRFRVGLQPERSLFSLDLTNGISTDERAFLAINTDVTNAADTSGSGDEIDIIHVRLIIDEQGE